MHTDDVLANEQGSDASLGGKVVAIELLYDGVYLLEAERQGDRTMQEATIGAGRLMIAYGGLCREVRDYDLPKLS